jgi:hypothetical protein
MESLLTESKKKVYTIPQGQYTGTWQDNFCWVNDGTKVIARVETKLKSKRRIQVKIIVEGITLKIYGRTI